MDFSRKKYRSSALILLSLNSYLGYSCATRGLRIAADGPAEVSTLDITKANTKAQKIGATPTLIDLDRNESSVFIISEPNKSPTYLILSDKVKQPAELFIEFSDRQTIAAAPTLPPHEDPSIRLNLVARKLMQAYQALSREQYEQALSLSDEAAALDQELAGPFIVRGIALLPLGRTEDARSALLRAKSLDAQDQEIDRLMQSLGIN